MPAPSQPIAGGREVWALLEALADKDGVKKRLKDLQDGVDSIVAAREKAQKELNKVNGEINRNTAEAVRLKANAVIEAQKAGEAARAEGEKRLKDRDDALRKREAELAKVDDYQSNREARIEADEKRLNEALKAVAARETAATVAERKALARLDAINKAAAG